MGHVCWSGGICYASDIPLLGVSEIQPSGDLGTNLCFQLLCINKEHNVPALHFCVTVRMT